MDTILWFIQKVICGKCCSSSYNLWKLYMISTFYIEVASTYSTTPSELFCPRTKIGAKCSKWQLLNINKHFQFDKL